MGSIKFYLVLALLVTFGAGLATGRLKFGDAPDRDRDRKSPGSKLCDELGLAGPEREKVLSIWKQTMKEVPPPPMDKFREIDRARDETLLSLLTDAQRAKLEQINADADRQKEEINKPAIEAFKRADEQTRALLTPEQQQKFDKIVSERSKRFRNFRGGAGK